MAKVQVLLIEDTDDIRFLTRAGLEREGYDVTECVDAGSALKKLEEGCRPQTILLDLMLPDQNGINLIPSIRKYTDAPIIIVTAKSELVERVVGLEMGADDYVVKPFQLQELLARVKAHVRRYTKTGADGAFAATGKKLKFGPWIMDFPKLQVYDDSGGNAGLSVGEFNLLDILVSRPGQVFTREQLLDKTRQDDFGVTDRAIDTQVARIRKKLGGDQDGNSGFIQSLRGAGYFFAGTVIALEE